MLTVFLGGFNLASFLDSLKLWNVVKVPFRRVLSSKLRCWRTVTHPHGISCHLLLPSPMGKTTMMTTSMTSGSFHHQHRGKSILLRTSARPRLQVGLSASTGGRRRRARGVFRRARRGGGAERPGLAGQQPGGLRRPRRAVGRGAEGAAGGRRGSGEGQGAGGIGVMLNDAQCGGEW